MDEPVAWLFKRENAMPIITDDPDHKDGSWIPLYTAPPKKEWVGLTDEEKVEIQALKWWDWEDTFDLDGYTRAIEAKLKEKNT